MGKDTPNKHDVSRDGKVSINRIRRRRPKTTVAGNTIRTTRKKKSDFVVHARTQWRELLAEVPRDPFIPDIIWVDAIVGHPQSGFMVG